MALKYDVTYTIHGNSCGAATCLFRWENLVTFYWCPLISPFFCSDCQILRSKALKKKGWTCKMGFYFMSKGFGRLAGSKRCTRVSCMELNLRESIVRKYASERIHPGFDAQGRRHGKSKILKSVTHERDFCPSNFWKRIAWILSEK